VRAAPFDLYLAGARMDSNYPLGPLASTAFNLTTMSYRGWLFLGLTVDTAAVSDPDTLLARLDDAYDRLLGAADLPRRRPDRF
jgi:diacylglycerol O-acyltransferase / wax synthase